MNKNIKLNKIKNIKTYNLAISDKDGYIKMDNQQNSVLSKLDDNGTINAKTISWNTLNKITPKKIDLLKIDIEGGEYTLLKQPKILNKVEEIRMELHLNNETEKIKCIKLLKIFQNKNFKIPKKIFTEVNSYDKKYKTVELISTKVS